MTAKIPTLFLAVSAAPRPTLTLTDPVPQVRAAIATLLRVGEAVTDPPVTLTVTLFELREEALAPITAEMPMPRAEVMALVECVTLMASAGLSVSSVSLALLSVWMARMP